MSVSLLGLVYELRPNRPPSAYRICGLSESYNDVVRMKIKTSSGWGKSWYSRGAKPPKPPSTWPASSLPEMLWPTSASRRYRISRSTCRTSGLRCCFWKKKKKQNAMNFSVKYYLAEENPKKLAGRFAILHPPAFSILHKCTAERIIWVT